MGWRGVKRLAGQVLVDLRAPFEPPHHPIRPLNTCLRFPPDSVSRNEVGLRSGKMCAANMYGVRTLFSQALYNMDPVTPRVMVGEYPRLVMLRTFNTFNTYIPKSST